jgi:hypothetical protein
VACAGDCEQEVRAINELIRRNQTASQKTGYAYQRNAIVCALIALVFAYLTFDAFQAARTPMLVVTGGSTVIFAMASFFNYSAARKFMRGSG